MKIPRRTVDKERFRAVVKKCKASPNRKLLNELEDLLEADRTTVTTRRGIRERLSALESTVTKNRRFAVKIAAELIEPENSAPMKLRKHLKKLEANRKQ